MLAGDTPVTRIKFMLTDTAMMQKISTSLQERYPLLRRSSLARKANRILLRTSRPRTFKDYNKVFCVGWLRTGTSSFGRSMRRLGFKHCGWDPDVFHDWYEKGKIEKVIRYARHFESFDDLPWNHIDIFEKLDAAYPNSKYVLLERDSDEWFTSFNKHRIGVGMKSVLDEREEYIREYERRNRFIKDYFDGARSDRLLVMNVIGGDGYEKLCPFLDLPIPNDPFPHRNKSK